MRWNNEMQALVENISFGIPVNTRSDLWHGMVRNAEYNGGAGGDVSKWANGIGLSAAFSPELVRQFGETAAKEYRALGITTALSPQVDLGTEPRWMRFNDTFGEYNRDAHYAYGKYAVYPGGQFEEHMKPFSEGAFNLDGGTKMAWAVMPYYSVSWEQDRKNGENVGNSYSSYVITDLLRKRFCYEGVVCTDWGITADHGKTEEEFSGRCFGTEHLSVAVRPYYNFFSVLTEEGIVTPVQKMLVNQYFELVDRSEDADARKESIVGGDILEDFTNRSYYGKENRAANESDLDNVLKMKKVMGNKPVIVSLSMKNPTVPAEFEPYADVILVD